ncbi:MAG: methionine adenosyltransferase [Bacteroidetes bacterium]|nr:methionine adenosyltransferase [Bacteroidota bacterium]MBU1578146.1 methionine adenosyltransferase [Bacteroidota bacterium]MBU2465814.1 methionine adenosyltransferase [Bacteroidota bacterium]MBU2557673.1 methionine adenosyltransferase [Bacteroidota bacterium]
MGYLFTSESVSEGHPDKVSDQISDAILDEILRFDPTSKVACETMVTTGLAVVAGEIKTNAYVDVQHVVRQVIDKIGYNKAEYQFDAKSCGVLSAIHEQSPDINQGVVRSKEEDQGAGDQGMMFGFACKETDDFMPITIDLSHILLQELAAIRREGSQMKYLRPDSKSQVTVKYTNNWEPVCIDTIVVSTQHDDFDEEKRMLQKIEDDVRNILIPRVTKRLPQRVKDLFKPGFKLFVNPTGKFVIGGPHGDSGLTGRKIIVDTYGGRGAHGGGAFSGKDASKVDRSAAYATRHIAKNMVAAGVADEVLVQVAYAIGVAEPVGFYINTRDTAKVKNADGNILTDEQIAEKVSELFDMRPFAIIKKFGLKNPVFGETAAYGHFGRTPFSKEVEVYYADEHTRKETVDGKVRYFKTVDFFAWEKLDMVDQLKQTFAC